MPQYDLQDYIRQQAEEAGIPPALALGVAEQESRFNPAAIGEEIDDPTDRTKKVRAIGTFQFLPSTAQTLGIDPHDPAQNIQGGVKYLRQLMDRHNGDLEKVLAEYGGVKRNTTYVPGVLARVKKFQGTTQAAGSPTATVGQPPPAPSTVQAGVGQPPPAPIGELIKTLAPVALPMAGSAIGGLAGLAVGGPPGAFAGSVAGGVVGEKGQIELEQRLGMPQETPELRRLGIAAAGSLAGEGLGQAGVKLLRPFAKHVTPEGRRAYEALKGKVTPAQITSYRPLDLAENIASAALIGGGKMASFREAQQASVQQLVEETVQRLGTATTPEEAGLGFLRSLEAGTQEFHQAGGRLYQQVDQLTQGARVPTASLKQFAAAELKKRGVLPSTSRVSLRLLRDITKMPDFLTFEQANVQRGQFLSEIRQLTGAKDTVAAGITKQLAKRVDEAMEHGSVGLSPQGAQLWRAANDFWRTGKEQFENELVRTLVDKDPSKIVDALMVSRAAVEPIRAARTAIAKPAWEQVRGAAAQRLVQGATDVDGLVQGSKLLTQLKTIGRPAVEELFGAQTEDLYKLGQVMRTVQQSQGEGTGRMMMQLMQARGVGQLMSGAATFGATGNPLITAAVLTAPEVLARVLSHPKGAKWLSVGLTVGPKQQTALRAIGNLLAGGTRAALQGEPDEATLLEPYPGLNERIVGQPPPAPTPESPR